MAHDKNLVFVLIVAKHREIGRRYVFTKNIMKKAQNDIDFNPSIMNQTILTELRMLPSVAIP